MSASRLRASDFGLPIDSVAVRQAFRIPVFGFPVSHMASLIDQRLRFPDPRLADAEGLVAIGGDLSVPRLLQAYRSGIFPWTASPVTWWSPDPRAIFELEQFHVSRSLARVIRQQRFLVTIDR